jgi:phage gp29-like protein
MAPNGPYNKPKKSGRGPGRPSNMEKENTVIAGEMLRSAQSVQNGGVYFLPFDQIILRQGWNTYRDMRHDDQVKACLAFKKILIHGRAYEIKPADDSEKAKKAAKFVEWTLRRINFKHVMKEALTAFDFGFSLGEIVWERTTWEGQDVIALKAIKHRDPESIEIKLDPHGNILGFKQMNFAGMIANALHSIELAPQKCWHYAHQSEFGNPYGLSDLRAAYRSWWAKKFIMNFWSVYLERMGSPMTVMKYPMGAGQDLKDVLTSILKGLSAKTEVLVPEGVTIELLEAQRAGSPTYEKALDFHNNSIARALLMVSLLGMGGENVSRGADSQSRLQLRTLFKMADDLAQEMIHGFCEQVLKPLVDMNFDTDLYPRFMWQDYGEFEGIEVADTIRLLHAAGIVDMDQNDVNYARSVLGLPLRGEGDKEDDVVRPQPLPPPANPNVVPPKAGQGNQNARG